MKGMKDDVMNPYLSHTLSSETVPLVYACYMFSECEM